VRDYSRMATREPVSNADKRWLRALGTLNESQVRLFVAERALGYGRGGISCLAKLTGMSRTTIQRGVAELQGHTAGRPFGTGRVRQGGGRRKVEATGPGLERELTRLLEATTTGDPMSALKWTSKSTRTLAAEVTRRGHPVSAGTVGQLLEELEYSRQGNVKRLEGRQHPDRDAQFRYLNAQGKRFQRTADPVVSVDTKKKELVGPFRNAGQTWRPRGQPIPVFTHDFPHLAEGKAIPYGTYDVGQDAAVGNVGISHDTAEFAVESIRRWWRWRGRRTYPAARRLLISADAGGSNGPRLHAWKVHLQDLAEELGLPITVCHYPPGTSKWNKIEHRCSRSSA
jgi:Rhodopirellula transposase DDE domain